MKEIELKRQKYRCLRPRDITNICTWGGDWEWLSPYGWKELLNYNRKTELNKILETHTP